jgi:hypothetical protein
LECTVKDSSLHIGGQRKRGTLGIFSKDLSFEMKKRFLSILLDSTISKWIYLDLSKLG